MERPTPKNATGDAGRRQVQRGGVIAEFLIVLPVLLALAWGVADWYAYTFQYQRFMRVAAATTDFYLRKRFAATPLVPPGWTVEQAHAREIANSIAVAARLEGIPGSDQTVPSIPSEVANVVALSCMEIQSAGGPGAQVTMLPLTSCDSRPLWVVARVTAPASGSFWGALSGSPSFTRVFMATR